MSAFCCNLPYIFLKTPPKTATFLITKFVQTYAQIKFTETQFVAILAQYEKGIKVADICREHGTIQPSFYE
jgi:hypothetical protein